MSVKTVKEVMNIVNKDSNKRCFLYFIGSPDETGKSWCPDCRNAQPFVEEALKYLPKNAIFVTVHTGDRREWKDETNQFRTDPKLAVSNVPTLMEFGNPNRLVESQLYDKNAIIEFFNQ